MAWVRLDDHFPEHPKVARLGAWAPLAGWLHVAAIAWCNRHLTDGQVPKGRIASLVSFEGLLVTTWGGPAAGGVAEPTPKQAAEALVAAGMWTDEGNYYLIHDYLDYQLSKVQVEALRDQTRQRVERWRERQGGNGVSNAVTNGGCNAVSNTAPDPDPDPDLKPVRTPPPPDDRFARFWDAYPRKVGKVAAERAFKALHVSEALLDLILTAVAEQRHWPQWRKDRGEFIPNPATWLHQHRWEDERPTGVMPTAVSVSDWNCSHTPRCANRRQCWTVTDIAAAKAAERGP